MQDGRFNWLEGQLIPTTPSGWTFALEGAVYYESGNPPNDAAVLAGLSYVGAPQIQDSTYVDFVNQLAPVVAFLKSTGEWFDPHPWLNLLLPNDKVDAYIQRVLANLTATDLGASGLALLYPVPEAKLTRPFLRTPNTDLVFLFSVLRTATPDSNALTVQQALARNRVLYDAAVAVGGTQYPVGSIPNLTKADWVRQYGSAWPRFAALKKRYDPCSIMTPGQGIFRQ